MTHSIFMRAAGAFALTALIVSTSTAPRVAAQGDANQVVPPNAFKDLKWRSVGATRGGRVTAYSGVRQQPHTFYFGGVGGGVWKTDDARSFRRRGRWRGCARQRLRGGRPPANARAACEEIGSRQTIYSSPTFDPFCRGLSR